MTNNAQLPPTPRWQREFPTAGVPDLITQHPDLVDMSYHNDICPSFNRKGWDGTQLDVRLWVDFVEPTDREFPERARYTVTRYNWDNQKDEQEQLYAGENGGQAIQTLMEATEGQPTPSQTMVFPDPRWKATQQ